MRDVLVHKHPPGVIPPNESLLPDYVNKPDDIIFDSLDADLILKAALRTKGAAGLAGLDAFAWRRLCSMFKSASVNLCRAMAAFARYICTSSIDSSALSAFLACRLIPLDKSPGVRPIGIGEVPRRIISKAILWMFSTDIESAAGPLQTSAGQLGGCEAAIHAMCEIYHCSETEGVLLVDAENAFNRLNRLAALHNIQRVCSPLGTVLSNCYKHPIRVVIPGSGEISSSEGTTQGDPLAMAMYALAVTPLLGKLRVKLPTIKQVWYADDSAAAGSIEHLREWWNEIQAIGPGYGYFPNSCKTHLIVKPEHASHATAVFEGTDIKVTTSGHKHLGAVVGSSDYRDEYVSERVKEWITEIKILSDIAKSQPHAAYSAFVHGLTGHWSHIMRTIPDIKHLLMPLEDVIHQVFIPSLTGRLACSDIERKILALPPRMGGLGLLNPSSCCDDFFKLSLS